MPSRREHYEFLFGRQVGPALPPEMQAEDSTFPWFTDGDTLIVISGTRQFKLHSSVLRRGSPYLARLLTEANAAVLSKTAIKKGVNTRYRLVLERPDRYDEVMEEDELENISFRLVQLNDQGNPVAREAGALEFENGRMVPLYYDYIQQVLARIYGKPLDIGAADEPESFRSIIEKVFGVKKVAEDLECVDIVTTSIEASLLACNQSLWISMATDPTAWLGFASEIRSRPLFREAMIHAVGKFGTANVKNFVASRPLDDPVARLLVDKGQALINSCREAELKIFTHYPTHMQREKTLGAADRDTIGRASYANDIYGWIAISVYRQFLGQIHVHDRAHAAEDLGLEYFRAIAAGGDEYLTRSDIRTFQERFPMSGKGSAVLETKINEIKQNVKPFVQSLLKNNSQLDVDKHPVTHMTCCTIGPEDYPWL